MKTKYLLLLFIVIFSAKIQAQKNDLLPGELLISDHVFMNNDKIPDYYKKIRCGHVENTKTDTIEIINVILNRFFTGKIEIKNPDFYSDFEPYDLQKYPTLTFDEAKKNMGYSIDTILIIDPSTGDYVEEAIVNEINRDEIASLYFVENWVYDKDKFTFEKQVKSFIPIRHFIRPDAINENDILLKKTFIKLQPQNNSWWQQRKIEKRLIHTNTIQYEFFLHNNAFYEDDLLYSNAELEKNASPFWSSYSRNMLVHSIVDNVLSGEITAYAFYDNSQKYTIKEVEEKMGGGVDTLIIIDPETGEEKTITHQRELQTYNIQSVIFYEDWYIDPETLFIKKTVKAIAPVIWYFVDGETELRKKIPFIVYFN